MTSAVMMIAFTVITIMMGCGERTNPAAPLKPSGNDTLRTMPGVASQVQPGIISFDPLVGTFGDRITVRTRSFGGDATGVVAHIGATVCPFDSMTDSTLVITIPRGALSGRIVITRPGITITSPSDLLLYQTNRITIGLGNVAIVAYDSSGHDGNVPMVGIDTLALDFGETGNRCIATGGPGGIVTVKGWSEGEYIMVADVDTASRTILSLEATYSKSEVYDPPGNSGDGYSSRKVTLALHDLHGVLEGNILTCLIDAAALQRSMIDYRSSYYSSRGVMGWEFSMRELIGLAPQQPGGFVKVEIEFQ